MRLIDADELSRAIRIQLQSCDGDYERALVNIALRVNHTNGIKAIPVEWIENYIKQNYCDWDLVYPEGFLKELVTW